MRRLDLGERVKRRIVMTSQVLRDRNRVGIPAGLMTRQRQHHAGCDEDCTHTRGFSVPGLTSLAKAAMVRHYQRSGKGRAAREPERARSSAAANNGAAVST